MTAQCKFCLLYKKYPSTDHIYVSLLLDALVEITNLLKHNYPLREYKGVEVIHYF